MGTSPFLTPPRSRRRARLRRRIGLLLPAGGALAIAAAVVAVVPLLQSGHGAAHGHRAARADRTAAAAPAPALSPAGLPLSTPAFALSGLGSPHADPVHLPFHRPPRAGLLFDLSSGRVLWQRHATQRLPIASLTKMMTALIAVRSRAPRTPVLITRRAAGASGSKVGVLPIGRHVSLQSLLYGLMLPSGNDAAVAIAQTVAGSVPAFVRRMNEQAASLGLGCTRFSSPHGFYDAGNFSCAVDLAALAHLVLEQPALARITRTRQAVLPFPIKGGKLYLYNNNPLLIYGYPGTTGLKTGYTIASGRCLVATAERGGVRLGVVLLNSPNPATQAKDLLDVAFERVYGEPPRHEPPIPAQA